MTEKILALHNFVFFEMSGESEHSNCKICLIQNYFSYQLTLLWTYSSQIKKFTKWSYYEILTEWGQAEWESKYFPESHITLGQDAWTLLHSVHKSWPWTKYTPVWPSHWVDKYIIFSSDAHLCVVFVGGRGEVAYAWNIHRCKIQE